MYSVKYEKWNSGQQELKTLTKTTGNNLNSYGTIQLFITLHFLTYISKGTS